MDDGAYASPPPDEYARENNLSIDSGISPFSLVFQLGGSLPQPTPDAEPSGMTTSDSHLPQLNIPILSLREYLDVPKEAIDLLAGVLKGVEIDTDVQKDTPLAQYDARKRITDWKFEPPALVSDPDYDCWELAKIIREEREPNISPTTFPSERLNVTKDEGLDFPLSAHQFRQNIDRVVHQEKLDVPREAIYHLARALHHDWSNDENRRMTEELMQRRIAARDCQITPPLSPLFQHGEYFIPGAEVCEIPVASDPISMLSDDLKAAESALVKELEGDVPSLPSMTPKLSPLLSPPPALSTELPRTSSFKLESPISPTTAFLLSCNEAPNIPALLQSMDIDNTLSHQDSSATVVEHYDATHDTVEQDLQDALEKCAEDVMRSIEQESITATYPISRFKVPTMDFSIPDPEWQALPMDVRIHIQWLHDCYSIELRRWPRDSRADSRLRWVPFTQKLDLKSLMKEEVQSEEDCSHLLAFSDVKEVPTSANYVWKRPGLAILCEAESDEEVEEVATHAMPRNDLASLVRKRQLENDPVTETSTSPSSKSSVDLIGPVQRKKPSQQMSNDGPFGQVNVLPSAESNTVVSTLLSNYTDIRTAKRQKLDKSSYFTTSKAEIEPQLRTISKPLQPQGNPSSQPKAMKQPERAMSAVAPCPELQIPNASTKLIKGLTLSRGLFSRLEQLYPTAEIVERDFDRWNTVSWDRHSVSRSPVVSSLAAEADIIVSPATGIIVTTLLKVIQKPLPGGHRQSAICDRINRVALRYERLVVLVSEGNLVDETVRNFTPSETIAYAEFVGFVAGIDTQVEVFYVGGGEATLAKWLVSLAVRFAHEGSEVQQQLIQDETQWEVFLRRAGFNAYAAQGILIRIKASNNDSSGETDWSDRGPAAFVKMTPIERVQRFRDLLGGERVLARVNSVLETRWT